MNNSLVIAAAIVAAALIVKYGPLGPGRYQIAGVGGPSSYVMIDSATGDSWLHYDLRWVPFHGNGARP
jgi:hypothetical protein